jgi:hypothetical protein
MDADASLPFVSTLGRDRDIYCTLERPQQAPMNSGGSVAQYGVGTASEHRGHPPRLFTRRLVTDGVDAAMDAMKAATLSSLGDRALRQPHLDELPHRDDPMLRGGDARNLQIDRGALVDHEDTKAPRPSFSPPFGGDYRC